MTVGPFLDVWLVDVEDEHFLALADSGLPDETDRQRAATLNAPAAQRALLARRAAVKIVLAQTTGVEPGAFRVVASPGGKPVVISPAVRGPAISIAHSGGLLGIAVASATSVGLDVERLRRVTRARQIAARWFGEAEAAQLDSVPDASLESAFMELWTAKEALAKRHGAGLRLMKGEPGELDVRGALGEGTLRYFDARPGYMAAVASTESLDRLRIIHAEKTSWTI